jgi:hypothetical protein
LKSLSLALLLAMCAAAAQASSITFSLVNAFTSVGSLTGTVDIDTTTKLVTSADITFHYIAAGSPVFTTVYGTAAYNGIGQDFISGPSNGPLNYGGHMALYFDTANLGLGNLNICIRSGDCGLYGSPGSYAQVYQSSGERGPIYLTSGELATELVSSPNAAATAEPSSLLLLGTGIVAGAAMMAMLAARRADSAAVS